MDWNATTWTSFKSSSDVKPMPSSDYDKGSVRTVLKNVTGSVIHDQVRFTFANQRVRAFNRQFQIELRGKPVTIRGDIPAGPVGLYQVFIDPKRYREKSLFLRVPTGEPAVIDEFFFVDPAMVQPTFPSYAALQGQNRWKKLFRVFQASGLTAAKYKALDDLRKAGVFNLFVKMETTRLPDGGTVFDDVEVILDPRPARIYARVAPGLLQSVLADRKGFHSVPGTLHHFPQGWQRLDDPGSFKTLDWAGNLQLTFATNKKGQFLVDADLDDHQGIEHAFDVIKHKVTGKDTDPYDIHQILVFFQGIDPGYALI